MYLCVGTLVPTRRYPLIAVPRAQHQHVHTYIGMYIVSLHKVKPVAAATHCFSCFVIAKASNKPLTTQTIFSHPPTTCDSTEILHLILRLGIK